MRTVSLVSPGRMEVREAPEPTPDAGEIVVAVAYCGICGSDLHEFASQGASARSTGMFQPVLGHEFTGRIAALGQGVDGLTASDPVVVHPGGPCGKCDFCRGGSANLCASQYGTGYTKQGAYAERVVVRARQALPLPDDSWLERAALTEPLGVALRALNRGGFKAGESIFIVGAGPIGLLTLLAARHKGAERLIVSEAAASRRALASLLGADAVLDPANGAPAKVRELTDGLGSPLSIECVGVAPAMDDCLAATRRGGRVVVAGVFEQPYQIDLMRLLLQEQAVVGTFGYAAEFGEAVELIVSGAIDVAPLISGVVTLDELPATFEQLTSDREGRGKVLVQPNG